MLRENTALSLDGNERWLFTPCREASRELGCTWKRRASARIFINFGRRSAMLDDLRTVRAPLFARFLFIILDLGRDRWLSVRST
jgi:hypothetical protein